MTDIAGVTATSAVPSEPARYESSSSRSPGEALLMFDDLSIRLAELQSIYTDIEGHAYGR